MSNSIDEQDPMVEREFIARKKILLAWKSLMSMQPFVTMHLLKKYNHNANM